jgi:hypothetical protein
MSLIIRLDTLHVAVQASRTKNTKPDVTMPLLDWAYDKYYKVVSRGPLETKKILGNSIRTSIWLPVCSKTCGSQRRDWQRSTLVVGYVKNFVYFLNSAHVN